MNYYFIVFEEERLGLTYRKSLKNRIIDIHPLSWQIENKEMIGGRRQDTRVNTLISWQEITEEEFNKYIEEINKK